jgi:signal transduction histidine kinase/DNA-binding response OmpR family regulator
LSRDNKIADLEQQLKEKDRHISELKETLVGYQSKAVSLEETGGEYDKLRLSLKQVEKDSKTKSEFLTSMGHEIRTPMNGIMGMTNLVLETDLTSDQRRHLEMVNSSAELLLDVVNDILDYTLIESGSLKLNLEDFNLSESLDCDLYLMKLSARQKNIDLEYQLGHDVPEYLNSDADRLVQVIMNLVNNAVKFTEEGTITVNVERLDPDKDGMETLKFSVTDTGIGIPPEKQKIISDTFNQTYTSYSRKFWGGGLGLTISAQLVHLAGGEIGLESSPGQGATFWFTWKYTQPTGELSVPKQTNTATIAVDQSQGTNFMLNGAKVLLAEDEPISRILIETLLEQAGLQIDVVENGKQAVEKALNGDYQAILMDVQMPVMDGLEATREIRNHERQHGGHLPVVALTAHAMHGDREKCLQAGMDDYLTKPLGKSELFDALTRYLTNTALVVDGDPGSQQMVVEFLIESGWRVTIAETGRSAMYEASLSPFDLILLDTAMAQGDGVETAKIIRRLEEYSGRQALILGIESSDAGDELEQKYRESGVNSFIKRPIDISKLKKYIEQR